MCIFFNTLVVITSLGYFNYNMTEFQTSIED